MRLRIVTLLSRIPPFHSELRCKYLLSANILPAQSYLHILFVPDAICQWNASTNTFVITVGRHLAGKAFPIPPLPLLDFYSNRVCSLLAPFDAYYCTAEKTLESNLSRRNLSLQDIFLGGINSVWNLWEDNSGTMRLSERHSHESVQLQTAELCGSAD